MGTIVKFPNVVGATRATSLDSVSDNIQAFRMGYIEDVSEFLLTIVINEVTRAGFELGEEDTNEVQLLFETMKAVMMKKNGYEHPLHEIAANIDDYMETVELVGK